MERCDRKRGDGMSSKRMMYIDDDGKGTVFNSLGELVDIAKRESREAMRSKKVSVAEMQKMNHSLSAMFAEEDNEPDDFALQSADRAIGVLLGILGMS